MNGSASFIAFPVQVPWESGCKPRWTGGRGRKKLKGIINKAILCLSPFTTWNESGPQKTG